MNDHPEISRRQSSDKTRAAQRIGRLANTMDSAFRLPGTRFRFGFDGLIGLIPGIGDLIGLAPLAYYIHVARKYRMPPRVHLRIIGNQLLDFLVGSVPVLGDLFDFAWKANQRNDRLLVRALTREDNGQPPP